MKAMQAYDQTSQIKIKSKDAIIHFKEGLIGFPNLKDFMLIENERFFPLRRLQSVDSPEVGFLVLEATILREDYHEQVPPMDWESIGVQGNTKAQAFGIVVIGSTAETSTGNFHAPLLINYEQMIGKQVILTDSGFPVRRPFV